MAIGNTSRPGYGIDAPNVLRNLLVFGATCLLIGAFGPRHVHVGPVDFVPRPMFLWTGAFLVLAMFTLGQSISFLDPCFSGPAPYWSSKGCSSFST
jgi:hypothetical protein